MRLLLLIQLIIFSFFPTENKLDLRGTWVLVEHGGKNQVGKRVNHSYDKKYSVISLFLIRKDSLVIMCGDGRPGKFAGHFILDDMNSVQLKGLRDDRNMMLPIAIEFTRKAHDINKINIHNDTLKFILNNNNEEFTFVRINYIEHNLNECDRILTSSYRDMP